MVGLSAFAISAETRKTYRASRRHDGRCVLQRWHTAYNSWSTATRKCSVIWCSPAGRSRRRSWRGTCCNRCLIAGAFRATWSCPGIRRARSGGRLLWSTSYCWTFIVTHSSVPIIIRPPRGSRRKVSGWMLRILKKKVSLCGTWHEIIYRVY